MGSIKKPARPWGIWDLRDLGKKSGIRYLKAIPVLILEKWLKGNKEEGVANFVWTKEFAKRLEDSKLVVNFKPKGNAILLASLIRIQNARNLTPPLIKYDVSGSFWINLPE